MLSEEKAATLPRKSGGMFVKAHQTGLRGKTKNSSNNQIRESFVDDGNNGGILVEELDDNLPKTQTLPRSYKTGMGGNSTKNRNAPSSSDQVGAIPIPNRPIGRAQSTNR